MPTYKRSAVTAKEGINFIRGAVEGGGSLFIKIEHYLSSSKTSTR
jgi:hypothetical protein